jgi:3-oxoadipate enol-lactonase
MTKSLGVHRLSSISRRTLLSAAGALALVDCGGGDGGTSGISYPLSENTVSLAFEEIGDPSHPMLLLIHGGTANRRAWDLMTPLLRSQYFLVAVDMRGHGDSPVPPTGYSALQLSADINKLINVRNYRNINVIGHSIGGMAALFLAAHRPDVINKVIVMDTPVTPNAIPAVIGLNDFIQNQARLPFTADDPFVSTVWNKYPVELPPYFLQTLIAGTVSLPKVTWRQLIGEVAKADITGLLPQVRQPVLVVWGALDGLLQIAPPAPEVPQHEQLLSSLSSATLYPIISSAGHNANYEAPDVLAQAIRSFVP